MTRHSHDIFSPSSSLPILAASGITHQGAADAAAAYGARALIFDLTGSTPDSISVFQASRIASVHMARIGVFYADDWAAIAEAMQTARLDYACICAPLSPGKKNKKNE